MSGPPRLPLARRLLYALLPLVVLLALVELGLRAAGLGEATPAVLGHGFDASVPWILRDGDGWRTRIMDHPAREVAVPPRGEARRVLLFGGSNTQILPEAVLAARLTADDPAGRSWEVVNLGREGYGSGRVAILVEQALALEPDAVVIYAGHNEFVELGFRRELEAGRPDDWQSRAVKLLSGLRSFNLLVGRDASPDWTTIGGALGEPLPARVDPSRVDMPYSETLAVIADYERNLAGMVAACGRAGVPVLICTPVSNHLSPPFVERRGPEVPEADWARYDAARKTGLGQIPPAFRKGLRPPLRLRLGTWFSGAAAADASPAPRLRTLGGALATAPATHDPKARSVAGAHWPDPAGWGPEVRQLMATLARIHAGPADAAERARLERARASLEEALAVLPDAPFAWFELGLVRLLLGAYDAADALDRSARYDRAPRKASPLIHAAVRRVAAAGDAALLDSAALFAERSPDGVLGYEVFMDKCHLQPGARYVLLADMAAALLELPLR